MDAIPEVLTTVDQVTPAWLTAALYSSGALSHGAVADFDVESGRGNWSSNVRLKVRYTPEAQGDLPPRLFVKFVNTDLGDGESFGPSEVTYYTRDYTDLDGAPLVRCHHAAYSEAQHRYHLVLDDVSDTHDSALNRPPTLGYALALAEALARLHAHWWGAQGLAAAGAPVHTPEHIRRYVDIARPGADHILAHCAVELQPHWPDAVRAVYARHPRHSIERCRDANGFSVIHGDPGVANILVPREGDRPIYLIDRQPFDWSLTTWLAVKDLVYATVLEWTPEERRQLEMPMLRHYHNMLLQRGVGGYTWAQLYDDYRLSIGMGIYIATEYCRGGINEEFKFVWMPMLQRTLTACDDLACEALWP